MCGGKIQIGFFIWGHCPRAPVPPAATCLLTKEAYITPSRMVSPNIQTNAEKFKVTDFMAFSSIKAIAKEDKHIVLSG